MAIVGFLVPKLGFLEVPDSPWMKLHYTIQGCYHLGQSVLLQPANLPTSVLGACALRLQMHQSDTISQLN